MIVESSAPTRVDLAGGTVDIWPLYLFHRDSITVNFAIDLHARCRIVGRPDRQILLKSLDTGESAVFEDKSALWETPHLKLLARLVYFFAPEDGLEMTTDCAAPPGSGLAGSSALNIAICGALNVFARKGYGRDTLIQIAKNVEAQVIDVPTGDQDYYPAMFGGVMALHLTPMGVFREEIGIETDRLREHLVLVYSGRQRNSGINNWDVMKGHIDGNPEIRAAFDGITGAAGRMAQALRSGRLDLIDDALDEEWRFRRQLSPGITTPEIEAIIEQARTAGARAAKICGAGGGGCFVLAIPAGKRDGIEEGLRDAGVHVIDYHIDAKGLQVRVVQDP